MDTKAVFWATALSAAIACIWIGVWANLPFALAPAMGLNAYFAYYVCNTLGLPWQNALACVAISGVLFMLLSIFKVQQKIVDAMPDCIKHLVGAGIGFFIAFTGLMQAGIIQKSEDTLLTLGDLSNPGALFGKLTIKGMFSGAPEMVLGVIFAIISFLFVDLLDSIGVLLGVSSKAGLVDEQGNIPFAGKALFVSAGGAAVGAVFQIMGWEESVSLGELDPSKILFVKDEYIHKIADTLFRRKLVNGHAIGRLGQELNVYASSGISDDHECVNVNEMVERLKVGMKVFIREGSSERNVDELIKGVIEKNLDTSNLMFCTDDKHAREIQVEGHINYNVSRAIELGLDPMKSVQMATVNTAKHFRMEDEIGSITPGRLADIILVEDWHNMKPDMVIFEGNVVAQNGELVKECKVEDYPDWLKHTVVLKKPVTPESFEVPSKKMEGTTKIHVIEMISRQIINNHIIKEVSVKNGLIQTEVDHDILKLAVVERYGKNGNIGIGFVQGFELKKGALAYSMSHDHHNIVVVGTNDEDMALAVNEVVRLNGGLSVACDGKIQNSMELPIGGLMSEKSAEELFSFCPFKVFYKMLY